jgi:hypothetical protein
MISKRSLRKETGLAEKLRDYLEQGLPLPILENPLKKRNLSSVSIRVYKTKDELGNIVYASE